MQHAAGNRIVCDNTAESNAWHATVFLNRVCAQQMNGRRRGDEQWYEVQDLSVSEILPQMVALSEAYLQVYQMKEQ